MSSPSKKTMQSCIASPLFLPYYMIFALILSLIISYTGYHVLQLSGEYRERNFIHLNQVNIALDAMRKRKIPSIDLIKRVENHVEIARQQAFWCTNNLADFEASIFVMLGAAPVLEICRSDVAVAGQVLRIIDRYKQNLQEDVIFSQKMAQSVVEIISLLENMAEESRRFHSEAKIIEENISISVKYFSIFLGFMLMSIGDYYCKEDISAA